MFNSKTWFRALLVALVVVWCIASGTAAQTYLPLTGAGGGANPYRASFPFPGFSSDLDFEHQRYSPGAPLTLLTFSRGGNGATNMIWTDPPGFTPTTYTAGQMRIRSGTNNDGWLFEIGPKANYFLNSGTPVSQTLTGLNPVVLGSGTGDYFLWINAEAGGSATLVGQPTGGTADITINSGSNVATHGSGVYFTVNSLGVNSTVSVTITGTVHQAQLENTGFATSYMPSTATAGARGNETATYTTLPSGAAAGGGTYFFYGVPYAANLSGAQVTSAFGSDTGSTASRIVEFRRQTGGQYLARGVIDLFSDINSSPWPSFTAGKLAMTAQAGLQGVCFNGQTPTTANNPLPSAGVTTMRVAGGFSATDRWTGIVKRIAYNPVAISVVQCPLLTTPYLLKRDFNPAANDNTPAFLNKAA